MHVIFSQVADGQLSPALDELLLGMAYVGVSGLHVAGYEGV